VGPGHDLDRGHAVVQLFLPASRRNPDDCGPAELGRVVRVSGCQSRGEQPVVSRPRQDARGSQPSRRARAAVRFEPRCARDH
jgi:hypothetical protein